MTDRDSLEEIIMAPPGPLLNDRAARILLIAGLIGLVAGVAGYFAYGSFAVAVLVGGGAAGGALDLFDRLLDRR